MNKPILKSRRFWKDRFHAYGWQVGFQMTIEFPDGSRERRFFSDIGVNKACAIAHAMRAVQGCVQGVGRVVNA